MAVPKFGASGAVETIKYEYNTEPLELQDEFHTHVFTKAYTDVLTFTNPSDFSCTYGTQNWNGAILTTATVEITEEQIEPTPEAVSPGTVPNPGDKLTKVSCLIIKRAKVTLTCEGKGDLPFHRGDTLTGNWPESAVGSVSLDPSTFLSAATPTMTCTSASKTDQNTDWEGYTLEFTGYIDGDPNGGHLITLPAYAVPTSPYYYTTLRRTISAEDKATQEIVLNCYDDGNLT